MLYKAVSLRSENDQPVLLSLFLPLYEIATSTAFHNDVSGEGGSDLPRDHLDLADESSAGSHVVYRMGMLDLGLNAVLRASLCPQRRGEAPGRGPDQDLLGQHGHHDYSGAGRRYIRSDLRPIRAQMASRV